MTPVMAPRRHEQPAFLLLVFLLLVLALHATARGIRDLLVDGSHLHQAGRYEEAEQLYRQVLALDGDQPDALHLLGLLTYQKGEGWAGATMIRQAIDKGKKVMWGGGMGEYCSLNASSPSTP